MILPMILVSNGVLLFCSWILIQDSWKPLWFSVRNLAISPDTFPASCCCRAKRPPGSLESKPIWYGPYLKWLWWKIKVGQFRSKCSNFKTSINLNHFSSAMLSIELFWQRKPVYCSTRLPLPTGSPHTHADANCCQAWIRPWHAAVKSHAMPMCAR